METEQKKTKSNSLLITAASLAVSQEYLARGQAKKRILGIPVRKPNRDEWVMTHPDNAMRTPPVLAVRTRENVVEEIHIVRPDIVPHVSSHEMTPYILQATINTGGAFFMWPLRLPKSDRGDLWAQSGLEAAERARGHWRRVIAGDGCYEVAEPVADNLTEPVWPTMTLDEVLTIALRDFIIDSVDHPVLRRLRGDF